MLQSVNDMYENLKEIHNEDRTATTYFNRGDSDSYDFMTGDLTFDDGYHDLDLSGVLPSGVKTVHMTVSLLDNAAGSYFIMRKKGNVSEYNVSVARTQVADVWYDYEAWLPCDENRFIQYRGVAGFTNVYLRIRGWTY